MRGSQTLRYSGLLYGSRNVFLVIFSFLLLSAGLGIIVGGYLSVERTRRYSEAPSCGVTPSDDCLQDAMVIVTRVDETVGWPITVQLPDERIVDFGLGTDQPQPWLQPGAAVPATLWEGAPVLLTGPDGTVLKTSHYKGETDWPTVGIIGVGLLALSALLLYVVRLSGQLEWF